MISSAPSGAYADTLSTRADIVTGGAGIARGRSSVLAGSMTGLYRFGKLPLGARQHASASGLRFQHDAYGASSARIGLAPSLPTRSLRPLSADLLPVLGRIPGSDGILLATGHGPTGLTLGPFSGKIVADMALGRDLGADIAPFSITRFQ